MIIADITTDEDVMELDDINRFRRLVQSLKKTAGISVLDPIKIYYDKNSSLKKSIEKYNKMLKEKIVHDLLPYNFSEDNIDNIIIKQILHVNEHQISVALTN